MKRLIILLLAAAAVLTACGKQDTKQAPFLEETVQEPTCAEEISQTGEYAIVCEWEAYATDVEHITFFVENRTAETLETGVDFRLERLEENGGWSEIPMAENTGWVALGVYIPAGGRVPMECWFSVYDHDFSGGGTYRIVKALNGQTVAGEFQMAEGAMISAVQPYGFAPLEELPLDFGAGSAAGNEVLFTGETVRNLEAVEEFLEKSGSGVACQLRTVQDYGEGTPMVIDVIFENDHFLWRMWSQGEITEQRFSYIVTDGRDLFLSNGADWAQTECYESDTAFLIPQGVTGAMLTAVERQAAGRMMSNVTRYRVWSADGIYNAALTEDSAEFAVGWQKQGEGSRGELVSAAGPDGKARRITALEWQGHDLLLTCETEGDNGRELLMFDRENWSLKDKNE